MARMRRMPPLLARGVAACLYLHLLTSNAIAAPPLILGGQAAYLTPHTLRLVADGQWMFANTLGLRARVGPLLEVTRVDAVALAGPEVSLDALTWVPSLYFLAGTALRDARLRLHAGGEIARYISMRCAMTFVFGGEWTLGRGPQASVGVGVSYHLH